MKRIEAVLLGIVMALGACGDDKKSTDCDTSLATIKLGAVLPITGNVQVGELWQNAARMALDDVNVAGGVNGHCVEMLVHDSQSSDTVSREQAQALLEAGEVSALLFQTSSETAQMVHPAIGLYFDEAAIFDRVPIFCTGCTAPDFEAIDLAAGVPIADASPLWRMTENNLAQGTAMAELVHEDGHATAGTYAINIPFGTAYIAQFKSTFTGTPISGTVDTAWQLTHVSTLAPSSVSGDATQVLNDLTTIFAASEPAALVVNSLPEVNVAVLESWEALGTPGALYMSFTAVTSDVFQAATVSAATRDSVKGVSYAVGGGTDGARFVSDYVASAGQQPPVFGDTY
ncbi:MAG: ABC transporter substrate-binding protein, partial [Myxococcota bacterium]